MDQNNTWEKAFEEFMALPNEIRRTLRRHASDELVRNGAWEVGSSDINHQLFSAWNRCDHNWVDVCMYYAEACEC